MVLGARSHDSSVVGWHERNPLAHRLSKAFQWLHSCSFLPFLVNLHDPPGCSSLSAAMVPAVSLTALLTDTDNCVIWCCRVWTVWGNSSAFWKLSSWSTVERSKFKRNRRSCCLVYWGVQLLILQVTRFFLLTSSSPTCRVMRWVHHSSQNIIVMHQFRITWLAAWQWSRQLQPVLPAYKCAIYKPRGSTFCIHSMCQTMLKCIYDLCLESKQTCWVHLEKPFAPRA